MDSNLPHKFGSIGIIRFHRNDKISYFTIRICRCEQQILKSEACFKIPYLLMSIFQCFLRIMSVVVVNKLIIMVIFIYVYLSTRLSTNISLIGVLGFWADETSDSHQI